MTTTCRPGGSRWRSRAVAARRSDFTRWPTPPVGGRRSAVLILLGEQPDTGPDVLVAAAGGSPCATTPASRRSPAGRASPRTSTPAATALREATEEVGLDPASTTVVATLPRLWIPVSGFVVTPVLAWWHAPHPVGRSTSARWPGASGCRCGSWSTRRTGCGVRHPSGFVGPAFDVRGLLVWGFTAGILNTLLDLGGWTVPWDDADRVRAT